MAMPGYTPGELTEAAAKARARNAGEAAPPAATAHPPACCCRCGPAAVPRTPRSLAWASLHRAAMPRDSMCSRRGTTALGRNAQSGRPCCRGDDTEAGLAAAAASSQQRFPFTPTAPTRDDGLGHAPQGLHLPNDFCRRLLHLAGEGLHKEGASQRVGHLDEVMRWPWGQQEDREGLCRRLKCRRLPAAAAGQGRQLLAWEGRDGAIIAVRYPHPIQKSSQEAHTSRHRHAHPALTPCLAPYPRDPCLLR
jgi:hypothetical protein